MCGTVYLTCMHKTSKVPLTQIIPTNTLMMCTFSEYAHYSTAISTTICIYIILLLNFILQFSTYFHFIYFYFTLTTTHNIYSYIIFCYYYFYYYKLRGIMFFFLVENEYYEIAIMQNYLSKFCILHN